MSHLRFCLALVLVAILAACSDSSVPDRTRDDIRGTVIDAAGRPLAGATVVLQFALDPPPASAVDKARIRIHFVLPETGPVALWISSFCDEDTVRRLITTDLPAGQHEVFWDERDDQGRLLPDGVYWFHLLTAAGEARGDFLLQRLGYGDVADGDIPAPLAVTDDAGRFTLDQGCLPFGHALPRTDESGNPIGFLEITRSVRVWAFSAGGEARAASNWIAVDPQLGADVGIVFGR